MPSGVALVRNAAFVSYLDMARLHEHQGKAILAKAGVRIPRGKAARTAQEAAEIARGLGAPVVVKVQAWTTGRAAAGGVAFADTPEQAQQHAARMLAMKFGSFPVSEVLVEEKLALRQELFVSFSIDDRARSPVLLLGVGGGSGVEERAKSIRRIACDVRSGPVNVADMDAALAPLAPAERKAASETIRKLFEVARDNEARSLEINPLAITADGAIVAADCRITIDDYAVFRHPEHGIEIARELDHPPTELEKIAYQIEQEDHRGTFFFAQMNVTAGAGGEARGLVGFHGAGGGGSMMSMDAITAQGFTIANFCDVSGNPPSAKVYRAARIILAQRGLIGYFGSGSGVANQEQFWSAYGLAKAFWEMDLDIPAVIRLGGNTEDRAVEILHAAAKGLRVPVEGYKKTDPPAKIAARFAELVAAAKGKVWTPRAPRRPAFVGKPGAFSFPIRGGTVWIDSAAWASRAAAIIDRSAGTLRNEAGRPAMALAAPEFANKDSELIGCEVECRRDGIGGPEGAVFVELPMPAGFRDGMVGPS